jgi:hypothetical protein
MLRHDAVPTIDKLCVRSGLDLWAAGSVTGGPLAIARHTCTSGDFKLVLVVGGVKLSSGQLDPNQILNRRSLFNVCNCRK